MPTVPLGSEPGLIVQAGPELVQEVNEFVKHRTPFAELVRFVPAPLDASVTVTVVDAFERVTLMTVVGGRSVSMCIIR